MASQLDCPEFMILHNKTIVEICTRLPFSINELKSVKGFGKRKLEEFGSQILDVIENYCIDSNIECTINREMPQEQQKVKINTKQTSLDLYKAGKTVQEIAAQRNLALSTIEGHMAHFISTGELAVDQFISPEKIAEISNYFLTHESRELSVAKEHFGDKFSYGELRMVIAHLNYAAVEDGKVFPDSVPQ